VVSAPRRLARLVFDGALAASDAGAAVRRSVRVEQRRLKIAGDEFDVRGGRAVYSIALGKAAGPMAASLEAALGPRLAGGVLSAPPISAPLSDRWRAFEGGHPLPNEASLAAARACFDLLKRADEEAALVVFLISGGGSAMLEWPRGRATTLADLREANRALVTCGASIAEVNAVRRAFSAVKGGGLARLAPRAQQVTLVVSDTARGQEYAVASGPTLAPPHGADAPDAQEVVARYRLAELLPAPILEAIRAARADAAEARAHEEATEAREAAPPEVGRRAKHGQHVHHVLLDNLHAVSHAAALAAEHGCVVEHADDVCDEHVAEGAARLVSRLLSLRERVPASRPVCLVSGGEFACPVRGPGLGGRNSETALRLALELEARGPAAPAGPPRFAALCAGTDGIDGNSPAAGAVCDETTAARARALGLDPRRALEASDSHTFFDALGDALTTGPTGTNVRDLRILVAR
jgi:glycerate 2-kinase